MAKRKGRFYNRAVFRQDDTGAFILPGPDGRVIGAAEAWHRRNVDYSPYCIPNELICAKIGTFLGLPIPAYAIAFFDNEPYFSSLNFNPGEVRPPHIDPSICVAAFPRLCTGIVFFDILVANNDRHDENLAVDNVGNPRQLIVYDHDQALLGSEGVARLTDMRDRLAITGSPETGGNPSCLLYELKTVEFMDEWRERIGDIPAWFLKDTCEAAVGYGINAGEAKEVREFLEHRRNKLREIIKERGRGIPAFDNWRPPLAFF